MGHVLVFMKIGCKSEVSGANEHSVNILYEDGRPECVNKSL